MHAAACAAAYAHTLLSGFRPLSGDSHRIAEWPLRAGEPVPITLEYFAIRALGELPRLLLEVLEVPYDSVYHFGGGYYKPCMCSHSESHSEAQLTSSWSPER